MTQRVLADINPAALVNGQARKWNAAPMSQLPNAECGELARRRCQRAIEGRVELASRCMRP